MKPAKERILIVDDEESMREYLSLVLEKEGYLTSTAADALEALRLVEEEPIDLVVEDLKMPKMDGIELLKRLKEKNEKLPVIIMTAFPPGTALSRRCAWAPSITSASLSTTST